MKLNELYESNNDNHEEEGWCLVDKKGEVYAGPFDSKAEATKLNKRPNMGFSVKYVRLDDEYKSKFFVAG